MTRKMLSLFLAVTLLCVLLCPSASAAPTKEESKGEIYSYLKKEMGCSDAVACGIMANIEAVSGYSPTAARMELKPDSTTEKVMTAYGLCQWTADRLSNLKKFDQEEYNTVNAQMRFLNYELLTSEGKAWKEMQKQPNTSTGAYETAVVFARDFLRILQYYEGVDQFYKIGVIAQKLYQEKTGVAPQPVTPPDNPGTTPGGTTSSFLKLPVTGTYTEGMFLDVTAKAWYHDGVADAVRFGLMKGQAAKIFEPNGNVTLAETVTMAARLNSIYRNGADTIKQSSGMLWYQPYVDYAAANGIVDASYKNKKSTEMNKPANRATVAEIIAKSMSAEALAKKNTIADNAIPDVKSDSSYGSAVYKLYRAGVLNGGGMKGEFLPWNSITRAEMATIMTRMADTSNRVTVVLK